MILRRLGCVLAAAACLSLAAHPVLATDLDAPRPANLRPASTTDEGGLWYLSDQAETTLRGQADVIHDEPLNTYVHGVACRLAHEYCQELRVYVLTRPFPNATMAPNGYSEVWSGLLLRANSEAELAFVLSHETTHFAMNHTVQRSRTLRGQQNAMLVVQVGLLVLGASIAASANTVQAAQNIMDATQHLVELAYLAQIAIYFDYSRDQESEADRLGLVRAAQAGYDPRAGVSFWQGQLGETAASDLPRVRDADTRINVFNIHPQTRDRLAQMQALAAGQPAVNDTEAGRVRYRAAIRPYLGTWLRDDLRRRDYGQTLFVINRLAQTGDDLGVLSFFRGECLRLRRGEADQAAAISAYEAAAGYQDAPVETWRELGNIAVQRHDTTRARTAFETYLARAPDAQDRWLVEASLRRLTN